MRKEYELKKLKVKRRGVMPDLAGQKKVKVRITISVDQDIVEYFKDLAAEPGALPYQTQINQALRQSMVDPAKRDMEALKWPCALAGCSAIPRNSG